MLNSLKKRLKRYLRPKLANLQSNLLKRLLGDHVIGITCETSNGRLTVGPYDMVVGKSLRQTGEYDRAKLELLGGLINERSSVLVVGAHVGALLVPLAKHCHDIIGYEANPTTYKLLEINTTLNKLNNVSLHNLAAGEADGTIEFWTNDVNTGGSKRKPKIFDDRLNLHSVNKVTVDMVALDQHLRPRPLDLVVMDIEGSEFYALKGMQKLLSTCKHLEVEFIPSHLKYLAGVEAKDFLDLVSPHFRYLYNESDQTVVEKPEFLEYLNELESSNRGTDLLFSKDQLIRGHLE